MNYIKSMNATQRGSSLLTVLVVLLVLSLVAVASYDSSNLQSLMTRNSQLRLETFNAGKVEIGAQLADFNNVAVGAIDPVIAQLLDDPELNVALARAQSSVTVGFDKAITLSKDGGCPNYGSEIKPDGIKCTSFMIGVTVSPENFNIVSDQKQTFDMNSL